MEKQARRGLVYVWYAWFVTVKHRWEFWLRTLTQGCRTGFGTRGRSGLIWFISLGLDFYLQSGMKLNIVEGFLLFCCSYILELSLELSGWNSRTCDLRVDLLVIWHISHMQASQGSCTLLTGCSQAKQTEGYGQFLHATLSAPTKHVEMHMHTNDFA